MIELVSDPGWVHFLGVPAADGPLLLGTYCLSKMREHAKTEPTQPRSRTCLLTLYLSLAMVSLYLGLRRLYRIIHAARPVVSILGKAFLWRITHSIK